jgi:hypothetical protein
MNAPRAGLFLVVLSILGIVFLFCSSCGMTTTQRLNAVNDVTASLMKRANPMLEDLCREKIADCRRAPTSRPAIDTLASWAETCPGFKTCWTAQKASVASASGIHLGVQTACAALIIGNETEAKTILGKILEALARLKTSLEKSGIVPLVMQR